MGVLKMVATAAKALVSPPSMGFLAQAEDAIDRFTETKDEKREFFQAIAPQVWALVAKDSQRGVWFTRLWNQAIRPAGATLVLSLLFRWIWGDLFGWAPLVLPDIGTQWVFIITSILGVFFWMRGDAKKNGVG